VADCVGGELRSNVCESTDWPEKLFVRSVCPCCEDDDSAGGAGLCRDAGR
jgi:hypothetical protein